MIQNSKFKIQNSRRGFTLIELLIAIAIIGILAATAIVNFGKNEDRDVRTEKDRLTSFLREAQNKALAGDRAGISTTNKICGYGIHFDSGNVQAYYASESGVDVNCSAADNTYTHNSSNKLDKFVPGNGVGVTSFSADIFFMIPTGDVYQASSSGGTKLSSDYSIGLTKGSGATTAAIAPGGIIK